MDAALWIIAGLLAAPFAAAGLDEDHPARGRLATSGTGWTEDVSDTQVTGIGAVEVLGALGLVLPAATGIATVLTPLAAAGLALTTAAPSPSTRARHDERGVTSQLLVHPLEPLGCRRGDDRDRWHRHTDQVVDALLAHFD